ncbi:MAG TPA: hypothetical protein VGE02_08900 [Gemmatimonadales bacterium]
MCDVRIAWVGLTDEVLYVAGIASDDCGIVDLALDLLDDARGVVETLTARSVPRDSSASAWEATIALSRQQRERLCGTYWEGYEGFRSGPYMLRATCGQCDATATRGIALTCCPIVELLGAVARPTCADPDGSGMLRRMVDVTWRVTRCNRAGEIRTRARAQWPGDSAVGEERVMRQPGIDVIDWWDWYGQAEEFTDTLDVPGGIDGVVFVELEGGGACGDSHAFVLRTEACTCEALTSTAPFTIVDAMGTDVSATVNAGGCISATSVTVSAPADARAGRFMWDAPATADAGDPFSTTVAVPDTDAGVTVSATMGSAPCTQVRAVTITRCQRRPGFCASVRLPCWLVEWTGVFVFYLTLGFFYVGIGLITAGGGEAALNQVAGKLLEALASSGLATGPFAAVITPVSSILAAYAEGSSVAATIVMGLGLAAIAVSALGLLYSLLMLAYWVTCCAPRMWLCRFFSLFDWILKWYLATAWLWGLVTAAVCLVAGVKVFTLGGIGAGAIFGYFVSGVLFVIAEIVVGRMRCRQYTLMDWPF